MNDLYWKELWQQEEQQTFKGWDFSHLQGRWESDPLPWDYRQIVESHLKSSHRLLDMDTGGGEFLLSLGHPYPLTTVTEGYEPNLRLCRSTLAPLGITVVERLADNILPFAPESFDIVLSRHGAFDPRQVYRVLKSGGYFITQQVGGENNNDLSRKLIGDFVPSYPEHTLQNNLKLLRSAGFAVEQARQCYPRLRFFDTGALVYYARIIPWEFPNFSVEGCFENLCRCQQELEQTGCIGSTQHRFLLVAQKR